MSRLLLAVLAGAVQRCSSWRSPSSPRRITVLAMIAFERGRAGAGGLALGFNTVSKIFPGILGLLLLAQRRWHAIGWSAAWGIAVTVAAWIAVGTGDARRGRAAGSSSALGSATLATQAAAIAVNVFVVARGSYPLLNVPKRDRGGAGGTLRY